MKMMLSDVIGHENQSQRYQHHRCLCLDLSGRITATTGNVGSYQSSSYFDQGITWINPNTIWGIMIFVIRTHEQEFVICMNPTSISVIRHHFHPETTSTERPSSNLINICLQVMISTCFKCSRLCLIGGAASTVNITPTQIPWFEALTFATWNLKWNVFFNVNFRRLTR